MNFVFQIFKHLKKYFLIQKKKFPGKKILAESIRIQNKKKMVIK